MRRFLFCVCSFLAVLSFATCTQSESDFIETTELEVSDTVQGSLSGENRYEMIARLHNEGLDYVYEKYFGKYATKSPIGSKENLVDCILNDNTLNEFLKSKGLEECVIPLTKSQVVVDGTSYETLLKDNGCPYYKELDSLFNNSSDLSGFQSSIRSFIDKVSSDESLNEIDKEALLTGSYIFASSTDYWSKNIDKWMASLASIGQEIVPETRGMNNDTDYEMRVMDQRGRGIEMASVYVHDGPFITQSGPDGYIFGVHIPEGPITVLAEGYKRSDLWYVGPNFNAFLEEADPGFWETVQSAASADGLSAIEIMLISVATSVQPGFALVWVTSLVGSIVAVAEL